MASIPKIKTNTAINLFAENLAIVRTDIALINPVTWDVLKGAPWKVSWDVPQDALVP